MREIKNLDEIVGGTTLSGSIINAFTNILDLIINIGRGLGSSIRRISENKVCPLK